MVLRTWIAIAACCLAVPAFADIIVLGDESRIALLRQCGKHCSAAEHRVFSPATTATSAQLASFALQASHAIIVVDSRSGPSPVIREHVLVARQAGIPSLSLLFTKVGELPPEDAMPSYEWEVRQLLDLYEMGGDSAPSFFDVQGAEFDEAREPALETALSVLASTPMRGPAGMEIFRGASLQTFAYALTAAESRFAGPIEPASNWTFWANGQVQQAAVVAGNLAPGDNGEVALILDSPIQAYEGSRYFLQHNGQIVAIGVVVSVGY